MGKTYQPFYLRLKSLMNGDGPLHNKVGQQVLADEVGVSRQCIAQYCNGITLPNVDVLCMMADFFGVSVDYLVGREPRNPETIEAFNREYRETIKMEFQKDISNCINRIGGQV